MPSNTPPSTVNVLFVCLGNICRSPIAQGAFSQVVRKAGLDRFVAMDSAGTHAYHVGSAPDERARRAARRRGIDIDDQRARKVRPGDFDDFDYILAMDRENLSVLRARCPDARRDRVRLFLDFAPQLNQADVPDPYYGEDSGFEEVLDLALCAAEGLLQEIRRQLPAQGSRIP